MKAIIFNRLPGTAISCPPMIDLVPDSAVTPAGMPVFLPQLSSRWEVRFGPAFRISRLGKGISSRFAPRYIDSVSIAARAIPTDITGTLPAEGGSPAIASVFDGALTLGQWTPYDPGAATLRIGAGDLDSELTAGALDIGAAIEAASAYMTLKTGDVIVPALWAPAFPVAPGDIIEARLDSQQVMRLKIK